MITLLRLSALLTVACSLLLLTACQEGVDPAQRPRDVAALRTCFPLLERLKVEVYRNQDWCKNMVYSRGKFSRNTEGTCNLFEGAPVPFDALAEADFADMAKAVAATRVALIHISAAQYSDAGKLKGAEFHLSAGMNRYSYVYDPGYASLPEDVPQERTHHRIDADWYFVSEDWN